ncbi:MAG: CHAT domain-containing protein [Bryobacteraceae bacterium]
MAQYAELEIALRRREPGGYPVEMRFVAIDSDSDERMPVKGVAYASIDPNLKLAPGEPEAYGKALGAALFADDEIRGGFEKARNSIQDKEDGALRVRLYIDAGAEELHRIHWETLCDARGETLFNGREVLFSRYLASSNWHSPRGKTDLKALIVVANPPGLEKANDPELFDPDADDNPKLAPVDVAKERQRAEAGFKKAGIAFQTLATGAEDCLGPATLKEILDQLDNGFDILYMVGHGALMHDGQARIYLEDGLTDGSRLVERIRSKKQLRLVILASCESAGGEGITASSTLSALGPLLVDAGVPAVIAMQGKVKMATMAKFMPEFLRALSKGGGQIDRAMGVAREAAADDDCDDYWMPVLFLRLRTGRLWYVPGLAAGASGSTDAEIWDSINRAIEAQKCTPILGPGVLDSLVGTTRELAKEMAGNRFPFSPIFSEELPTVAQYLAVRYKRPLTAKEDLARQIARKLVGESGLDPENPENLSRIIAMAGKAERAANPLEPHRVLASRPFAVYLTTNSDTLMEDALEEAGRHPRCDFSRWNKDPFFDLRNLNRYPTIREREKSYIPSVENPLVYHLFGQLDLPGPLPGEPEAPAGSAQVATRVEAGLGSTVLTEDDFFNYLLNVGSKADAKDFIPGAVGTALTANSLLFLGFRLDEWSFRVLLRSIFNKEGSGARMVGANSYPCVGAQLQPEEDRVSQPVSASRYFEQYLRESKIDIFWGSTAEFIQAFQQNTSEQRALKLTA